MQRLVVTVKVEHQVGVERHMQQLPLQAIRRRVAVEIVDQPVTVAKRDQREIAVEVGARTEVEPPLQLAEVRLRRADRVRLRHDGDVAENGAVFLRLLQPLQKEMGECGARQFVGVQRRLDIGPGCRSAPALEAVDRQAPFDTGRIAGDDDFGNVHGAPPVSFIAGAYRHSHNTPQVAKNRGAVLACAEAALTLTRGEGCCPLRPFQREELEP